MHETVIAEVEVIAVKYRGSGKDGVLRIVVFSTHTKDQIDYLTHKLGAILQSFV